MTRRGRKRPRRNSAGERKSGRKSAPRNSSEATFTVGQDFRSGVLEEEVSIITRLSDAITERLGPNASEAEREAAAPAIWAEDPALSGLLRRLTELMRSNPKSIARGLIDLAEAEEERLQEP